MVEAVGWRWKLWGDSGACGDDGPSVLTLEAVGWRWWGCARGHGLMVKLMVMLELVGNAGAHVVVEEAVG